MKHPLRSKTLWVNILAIAGIIYQAKTGDQLFSLEAQASILAAINIILRIITREKIVWK